MNGPELRLWRCVLLQAIRDLLTDTKTLEKRNTFTVAIGWLGVEPSESFDEVCVLAGIDTHTLHRVLIRQMKRPPHEREKLGRALSKGEVDERLDAITAALEQSA